MRITRRTDGTYWITGLTHDDIDTLTQAASTAAAWYADREETPWNRVQLDRFDNLYQALAIARDARSRGSVLLDRKYEVLGRTGMQPLA